MDLSKLKTSDWVIGVSALVLLIASFLDWFTVSADTPIGSVSAGGNGWDVGFFWAGIPVILGLAMAAFVALRAFSPETELPKLPIEWGLALFIAGAVATAIILLKVIVGEDAGGLEGFGVDVSRAFGLFLALLAAAGLAVGGYLKWQEEKSGADVGATGTTPPTPF